MKILALCIGAVVFFCCAYLFDSDPRQGYFDDGHDDGEYNDDDDDDDDDDYL